MEVNATAGGCALPGLDATERARASGPPLETPSPSDRQERADLPAIEVSSLAPLAPEILLSLQNCDLVGRRLEVEDLGVSTTVPETGFTHEALVSGPTRSGAFIGITNIDGATLSIEVREDEEAYEVDEGSPPATDPCQQLPYQPISDNVVTGNFSWRANVVDARPTALSADQARLGLKSGFDGILTQRNNCGRPDTMPRTATLGSDTRARSCDGWLGDGISASGFGDLASNTSGISCRRAVNNSVTEADIRINSFDFNWVNSISSLCGHSMRLPSTMTHEVGHIYNLGDLLLGGDALTMYGRLVRCSEHKYTLGLGDWRGLDDMY